MAFREYLDLARSVTARTTYLMFAGNLTLAVLGFIVVIVAARVLGPVGFGLFFALYNFIQLISSVADAGVGSGIVNFIPRALAQGNQKEADQYLKAGWNFVLSVSVILTIIGLITPFWIITGLFPGISPELWWITVFAATSFILINYVISAFQARKEFSKSVIANLSYSSVRTVIIVLLTLFGKLNVFLAMAAYAVSSLIGLIFSFPFLPDVLGSKNKPTKQQSRSLLTFSAHLGLGKIAANLASRIDVQMLFPLAGAAATAQYGIAQKVAFLYVLFSSSAAAVITPKIASITDLSQMKIYARKVFLLSLLLVCGLVLGAAVADPLIPILFGTKYPGIVPVVRWMLIASIPFILNMTPVNLVIYYYKNSKLIGVLSAFQLLLVVLVNWMLIPQFGVYGSILAYAAGNITVGLVTWYKVKAVFV